MTNDALPPVTVIGLGAMGHALATTLLGAGHPTTVWNRTPEKADDLVAKGATRAGTVREAVQASPVVILCVLDYAAVHGLLDAHGDVLTGRTLVNLTNGRPQEATETAEWAAGHGAEYVDGGIMAVPPMIGTPEAFILYSGSRTGFERAEPLLTRLATPNYLGADPSLASLYDLALLSGMYGMFAGARHATAMVGGERAREFTETLLAPWLQAMTATLTPPNPVGEAGDIPSEDSPLDMQAVALVNIVEASRAQGVPVPLLSHLLTPMRDIVAAGQGDVLRPVIPLVEKG
ncbi:MAG TPA: NAD(P)-binding domain-containing protein [Thermomonospora sp.]|nr:NAD(P)-binding domain-containing protein [Thermomonospora sp.]